LNIVNVINDLIKLFIFIKSTAGKSRDKSVSAIHLKPEGKTLFSETVFYIEVRSLRINI